MAFTTNMLDQYPFDPLGRPPRNREEYEYMMRMQQGMQQGYGPMSQPTQEPEKPKKPKHLNPKLLILKASK